MKRIIWNQNVVIVVLLYGLTVQLCLVAATRSANATPIGFATRYGSNDVIGINLVNGTIFTSISVPGSPTAIAASRDSSTLYVANQEAPEGISFIDVKNNNLTQTVLLGHPGPPIELEILPSGKKLYAPDWTGGGVSVVDVETKTTVAHLPTAFLSYDVAIAPDSTRVYTTALSSSYLFVIDPATDSVVDYIGLGQDFNGQVAVTPDGSKGYVTQFRNQIAVVDLVSKTVANTIFFNAVGASPNNHALTIAIDPLGAFAFALGFDTINVVDLSTDTLFKSIPVGIELTDVAFDPLENFAYVLATERVIGGSSYIFKIDTHDFQIRDQFVFNGTLESLVIPAAVPVPSAIFLLLTGLFTLLMRSRKCA